ncbi:50S ribosomal protein L29 [SAR202 cluster bacterium AC-409-J13_OGT_754m]|nr:50S ribosomal protein L29 [SAR202 cluster bacterium AC-409-J13_OGT_754m]
MRVNEIRELDNDGLKKELDSSLSEMMNLRFRHSTRQLTNTNELAVVKKRIARLRTIMRQRAIQEENNE